MGSYQHVATLERPASVEAPMRYGQFAMTARGVPTKALAADAQERRAAEERRWAALDE
jgi:hypothetical protein